MQNILFMHLLKENRRYKEEKKEAIQLAREAIALAREASMKLRIAEQDIEMYKSYIYESLS